MPVAKARFFPRLLLDHWIVLHLPRVLRQQRVELFFSSTNKLPISRVKRIATFHDLAWYFLPHAYTLNERVRQWLWTYVAVTRADRLLVVSEHTKQALLTLFPRAAPKLVLIPEGVGEQFCVIEDAARLDNLRARYGLPGPFILTVCTLSPRKNLLRLFEAFARLRTQDRITHQLVVIGKRGWLDDEIVAFPQRAGIHGQVIFTDYVSEEDLILFYNSAEAFVYPSLYEGFGLAVLEAMACGLPVVCSNVTSLPEVVGDAGILVDPYSVDQLTQALAQVLKNAKLRRELRARGLQRARQFRWDVAAHRLLSVFAEVMESRTT
jgi:glycosyltransferase involved in cell wall biosynthesis